MEKKHYSYPCVKIVEIDKNDLICCSEVGFEEEKKDDGIDE